jgi:hypothetical protein
VLAGRRPARRAEVDNAADRSGGIDYEERFAIGTVDRRGSRETSRKSFPGPQQILLRRRGFNCDPGECRQGSDGANGKVISPGIKNNGAHETLLDESFLTQDF